MYCLPFVSFAVPFSFENVDERQALYRGAGKNGYFAAGKGQRKRPLLKGSWLFPYFLFDICMEVHYQLAWAKVSNFPRSPKFCSINFETFTINDSLLPSTSPPELAALQLISACSGISNPFFPQIMWFWVCHGVALRRTLQWGKCFLAITRTELRCTLINCGQSYNKLLMRSLLTYRRLYVHSRVFSFLVRLVQKKFSKIRTIAVKLDRCLLLTTVCVVRSVTV